MPRWVAVELPAEVHAQSIFPVRPAARGTPATKGLRRSVMPPAGGRLAPSYVTVITPVLSLTCILLTYLLRTKAAFNWSAAARTPAMPLEKNPSAMAVLAAHAR